MKDFTYHSYGSHVGRMNYGGAKFCRFALFPLMLLMLLLLPTRMVAQTDYAYAEFNNSTGTLTFKCGLSKPEEAYELNEKTNKPGWLTQRRNIEKVVFDASFANARPTSCYEWFDDCYHLTQIEGIENLNTEKVTNMSYMFSGCYELTSLDVTNFNTANVKNMMCMFCDCYELTSLDVTNFNTANVTDMGSMFAGCYKLTSLDVTNFNTAKVTDMGCMFYDCSALTTIYAGDKFVTGQAIYGLNMFYLCKNLKGYSDSKTNHTYANCGADGYFTPGCGYVEFDNATGTLTFRYKGVKPAGAYDLNEGNNTPEWRRESVPEYNNDEFYIGSKINISKVVFDASFANARPTSCYKWFDLCTSLTEIEGIENLNTEEVTNMGSMFSGCYVLKSLDVSNFNTQNVTNMSDMFTSCTALKSLNVSNFDTQKVKDISKMFYNCNSLTSLDVSNFDTQKVENMRGMFSNCKSLITLDLSKFDTQNVTNMSRMFWNSSALKTIYVSDKFVTTKVSSGSEMFKDCTSLKGTIDYVASKIDHTYANCGTDGYFTPGCGYAEFDNATGTLTFRYKGVKPAGAYGLNEGTSDPGWIGQRSKIKKVVFDASFANARPTSCYKWFYDCKELTNIEGIEYLNTEKVTDMSWMFSGCAKLSSINLSNFNTEKVTDMSSMFWNCSALTSLDVSKFNTANVTDMSSMFWNCSALASLDVSKFNTAEVTSMSHMFCNCYALTLLDLSNFNTEKVEYMGRMFDFCSSLTSLDLSIFNTEKVTDMSYMFRGCSVLTTIYASDKFVTDQVTYGVNMFSNCTKLKGFIDYMNNSDKTDHTYANYETGYFTKLVGKNGDEKIGAAGETLATDNLVLDDGKDFVAYETFAAKKASYSRTIPSGSKWGTLCVPFAIVQSQETECKFYRLTGIDDTNECITLESYEEGTVIPAGTPVLFKMNEGVQKLEISAQDADLVKEPVAGTNTDVNLVGSFTKIGGKDNQGLDKNDYIISKNKFWRVSDLTGGKGVGSKPMHAYIHPATASQARAAMLSIGKGDGTTAIDNLNAISNDANAEYYDANGRRTNGLQKGLNIVKRGSKTYKIMVK